jgi:dUTP pyrophosphatase
MKIKRVNPDAKIPSYETVGSAGMDLTAMDSVAIPPLGRRLVKTGIAIQLEPGYEAQIRPRSGRAYKEGLTVLNAPGTIDSDYIGEVGVILYNASNVGLTIFKGERIAQMVIAKYEQVTWEEVEELETTERGAGGFGSTGN